MNRLPVARTSFFSATRNTVLLGARLLSALFCFVLFDGAHVAAQVAAPTAPAYAAASSAVPLDAAATLNLEFRSSYARARAEVLAASQPIIYFDGEKLVLIDGKNREEGTLLPAKYQRLKAIAHQPFTLYLTLRTLASTPAAEATAERRRLRTLIANVERELPTYEFTPEELSRQQTLLGASGKLLDELIAGEALSPEKLLEFTRRMGPLQEANAEAAAAIELGHYRKQADVWRAKLGEEKWKRVSVVVSGSQMPRLRNRVVQLFAAILEVPGEGKRIVYAEGLYDPEKALNLFATHRLDSESAAAFFDDPARLDEDLLSRGAAKYVRENFPSPAK